MSSIVMRILRVVIRGGLLGGLLGALFGGLTGCTSGPVKPQKDSTGWHMQGYFGLKTQNPEKSMSGNIDWVHIQEPRRFDRIALYGPLGADETVLTYSINHSAMIQTSGGKIYQASTPERLMEETLGWSVPIEGWVYWIQGKAEPGVPVQIVWSEQGRVQSMTQSGWKISYQDEEWIPLFQAYQPMDIILERKNLWLKIQVNRWLSQGG